MIFVFLFFPLFINASNARMEFQRLKYPKEITISKDWKEVIDSISWVTDNISIDKRFPIDEMNAAVDILYQYSGPAFETAGEYFFTYTSRIIGRIYYFNKKGLILPRARKYLNHEPDNVIGASFVSGQGANHKEVIYEEGQPLSFSLVLISPAILQNTDIKEAILEKKLSGILLALEKVVIKWELSEGGGIKSKEKTGQWIVKIDRAIRIDINYTNDNYSKGRRKKSAGTTCENEYWDKHGEK